MIDSMNFKPPTSNPFIPKMPVDSGRFGGRNDELQLFEECLVNCRDGTNSNILYLGERGIGKSALVNLLQRIANGNEPSPRTNADYNFNSVVVRLSGCKSEAGIVHRITKALENNIGCIKENKVLKDLAGFVLRFKVGGSGIESKVHREQTVDDLRDALCKLIRDCIKTDFLKDGLVIIIDEADSPSAKAELGQLLKTICENLIVEECGNIAFVLAGLPELPETLNASHGSAYRLFEEIELGCLTELEARDVINKCISHANKLNPTDWAIEPDATAEIIMLSEGYPYFLHEFGKSAFQQTDRAKETVITLNHVQLGAHTPKIGAIDILGKKFFEDIYYRDVQSDNSRKILMALATSDEEWTKKSSLTSSIKMSPNALTKSLKRLREKNIIKRHKPGSGLYKLETKTFAIWLKRVEQKKSNEMK